MSSLMNLKDCIRNRTLYLEDQSSTKHYHIPFRSNKLTLLLKESLETENSRTTMSLFICNCSPNNEDSAHSISSLKYAEALFTHNTTAVKIAELNPKDPSTWDSAYCLQRLQKRDPIINASFLEGMNGKNLLDVPQNLFMKKLIELGISEMKACKIYEWFWGLFIDARASKKKNLMKCKEITKYKTDEELAEDERKEIERMQKQKDKELAELVKNESLTKPTMAICATCGKSVNSSGLEKHTRLCN